MGQPELEQLAVRLWRLELNWNHRTPAPLKVRRIPLPPTGLPGPFSCVKLVVEGRFLLCGSSAKDAPVYCMILQGQQGRLARIGAWYSDELSWTGPVLESFDAQLTSASNSELTVAALFSFDVPEEDEGCSSIAMWRVDIGRWPIRSTRIPPLNFKTEIERFTVAGNLIACWGGDRIHVVEYTPGSATPIRQGIFDFPRPDDDQAPKVKILPPSHLLIASNMQITLYAIPHLHDISDVNEFAACQSPATQVWKMALGESTGQARLLAIPDRDFLFPYTNAGLSTPTTPFHLLTAHLFYAAIPLYNRTSSSVDVVLRGIQLPSTLYNPESFALIGVNGKRGVWLHSVPAEGGASLVRLQLVDFWGMGRSARSMSWAELNTGVEVMQTNTDQGNVQTNLQFEHLLMYTFDEASGKVVFSMKDSLMVYDFAPEDTFL